MILFWSSNVRLTLEPDMTAFDDHPEDGDQSVHPLGPMVEWVNPLQPSLSRCKALLVLIGCVVLISIAVWVSPDRTGLGSHQQLGLPRCNMVMITGYPCPTCGMTTAFSYSVRGRLISAIQAHPAGFLLAILTMMTAIVSVRVICTGKVWVVNWYRISPAIVIVAAIAVILLGWIFKLVMGIMNGSYPVH